VRGNGYARNTIKEQVGNEVHITVNGRNIPFVNHVKYLVVIVDKRITWRLQVDTIETKAFRTFDRIYSLFRSERLSANIKITFHKALIRSVMTYACPAWEIAADTCLLKLQRMQNKDLRTTGKFSKVRIGPRFEHGFQPSVYTRSLNKIVQATIRSYTKS
jgi:hypothetical protein